MPQGNQLDFKSINDIVEKYAIVGEDYIWTLDANDKEIMVSDGDVILGLYNDIKSLKSALRWHRPNMYLSTKIKKVKITIEEVEEIFLDLNK